MSGRGKGGKGAGKGSPSGYGNTSKLVHVCHAFLAGKDCEWGDDCKYEHIPQKQLDARAKKRKTKKKKKKL